MRTPDTSPPPDRHDLYELCVQSPTALIPFLNAVHGRSPRVLGEDFCGSAALSRRWVRQSPGHRAVAVDLDPGSLARAGTDVPATALRLVNADVRAVDDPADLIFVGNFSIGYHHTRHDLLAYLRHARQRLARAPGGRGELVCDTYGGESAFLRGEVHRDHWILDRPDTPPGLLRFKGCRVRYTWEQREADPVTAMVTDVCHFSVIEPEGTIAHTLDDAFVYRWRLWSVPELRDALLESGFEPPRVYAKTVEAVDDEGNAYVLPVEDGQEELEESFIVCVAAGVTGD